MEHVTKWSAYTKQLRETYRLEKLHADNLGITKKVYVGRCKEFDEEHHELIAMAAKDETGILPPGALALLLKAMRNTWCRTGGPAEPSAQRVGSSSSSSEDPAYFGLLNKEFFEYKSREWDFTSSTRLSKDDMASRDAWFELEAEALRLGHFQDTKGSPSWDKLSDEAKAWGATYAAEHKALKMSPRDFEHKRVSLFQLTLQRPLVNIS